MAHVLEDFPISGLAARALAHAVATDLHAALLTGKRALLLVSGGRSPIPFFEALSAASLPWERVDISLADERSVAPDSEASNAGLVRRHLMTGPAHAARWIGLMPESLVAGAADPWDAARQAALLANANPALAAPDVVVLGLGTDGHTASLFPDAPEWPHAAMTCDRYVALQPQHAPHARISLSLHALREQKRCYLWAVGQEKRGTISRLEQASQDAAHRSATDGDPGQRPAGGLMQDWMRAGPVACLMADPAVELRVYCSREE